ncbi:MAG: NAD-dependent protein deacylase [Deltaproteobacteria bacterium]|nr:NAD-dependent protein deacylase [Deltaproteobacteria bacterium]
MSLDTETALRVAEVRRLLDESRRLLFITGAGLSADAGLPTYRGVGGIYDSKNTDHGIPIEVALSGPTFRRDPELTWRYIHEIEQACRGARPAFGHEYLARLEATHEVVILTQNVDGLHHAAGSSRVIAIHGDLRALRCTACDWRERVEDYAHLSPFPHCEACGAVLRPDVVLFEEMLPLDAVDALQTELARGFDLILSVGTSAVFPYIAGPVMQAARAGRPTVEVNPTRTMISGVVSHRLPLTAAVAFEAIEALGAG